MPTLTEQVQTNIRALTSTTGMWVEDWHALFDLRAILKGQFSERLIAYYIANNPGQNPNAAAALNYYLLNPSAIV